MLRTNRRRLLATVPAALALVLTGSTAAVAATDPATEYTMRISPSTATVPAGHTATAIISFQVSPYLRNTRVTLSATGLPSGVTARFFPATPRLSGRSVLALSASSSAPAGLATITITAITISSDPIGTSATFGLTTA